MKTKKWYRPPTAEEIASFDGLHCSALYRSAVRTQWRCPSCGRTAQELIRWSEIRGSTMRRKYGDEYGMGFTISLTYHHCHNEKSPRFAPTLICGDCNSADGVVKHRFGLPDTWSFDPSEIGRFVTVLPYSGRTSIDYDVALKIFHKHSAESWADDVTRILGDITGRMLVSDALKLVDNAFLNLQGTYSRLGAIMQSLCWRRVQAKIEREVVWVYNRGDTPEARARLIYVFRDPVTDALYVSHDPPGSARPPPPGKRGRPRRDF